MAVLGKRESATDTSKQKVKLPRSPRNSVISNGKNSSYY